MSRARLNATAASLLGFLHMGPMAGWDLARTAQTVIGDFWSLTRSQVYRELRSMAEQGLVEAGEPEGRDRRPYRITRPGRDAFADWLTHEPSPETIRFPLLLTVSFGRHLDASLLADFVATHRVRHEQRLADYERDRAELAAGDQPDRYLLATLEFGITYERSVLEWFDHLPRLLDLPPPPG